MVASSHMSPRGPSLGGNWHVAPCSGCKESKACRKDFSEAREGLKQEYGTSLNYPIQAKVSSQGSLATAGKGSLPVPGRKTKHGGWHLIRYCWIYPSQNYGGLGLTGRNVADN